MRGDRPPVRYHIDYGSEFPPHARGSTRRLTPCFSGRWVSPACAGIDRRQPIGVMPATSFPRMRGDRPWKLSPVQDGRQFPPHARGSTCRPARWASRTQVSPACAGIDRHIHIMRFFGRRFPRMRGDRPSLFLLMGSLYRFPPHARGSTPFYGRLASPNPVSPACAGIDLCMARSIPLPMRFPRMRGDRPLERRGLERMTRFPPHARGSTLGRGWLAQIWPVSPACAGIDLTPSLYPLLRTSFPRMRGDRPLPHSHSYSF